MQSLVVTGIVSAYTCLLKLITHLPVLQIGCLCSVWNLNLNSAEVQVSVRLAVVPNLNLNSTEVGVSVLCGI